MARMEREQGRPTADGIEYLCKELEGVRELLRDAFADLLTMAGEPLPGEQYDYRACAKASVENLHKKARALAIRLNHH